MIEETDTIVELRKNIALKERYDGPEKVKILLIGLVLPDQLLVKDFMDTKLGVEFAKYPITCTSDEDIYVWAGVKKCIKLELKRLSNYLETLITIWQFVGASKLEI